MVVVVVFCRKLCSSTLNVVQWICAFSSKCVTGPKPNREMERRKAKKERKNEHTTWCGFGINLWSAESGIGLPIHTNVSYFWKKCHGHPFLKALCGQQIAEREYTHQPVQQPAFWFTRWIWMIPLCDAAAAAGGGVAFTRCEYCNKIYCKYVNI